MAGGKAPFVIPQQALPGRDRFELHHVHPRYLGGGVFDVDNIMVVTPLFHNSVLEPRYHYGWKNAKVSYWPGWGNL
jgi:hypothetical protein